MRLEHLLSGDHDRLKDTRHKTGDTSLTSMILLLKSDLANLGWVRYQLHLFEILKIAASYKLQAASLKKFGEVCKLN